MARMANSFDRVGAGESYNAPRAIAVTISRAAYFPARFGALSRVNDFLEDFCREAAIGREQCLRVNLLLEELFTNTVRHGHRGDCDAPVWVFLARGPAGLRLTYEDTAPPFNPYARPGLTAADAALEERKVGGLGVHMTRALASRWDYAYVFGRNRIELTLA
jgi:anti-sigma regulatory factor (Ser/Thr protein kinase)